MFVFFGAVDMYAWLPYPALATLIDCCSIASWMLMRSCSLMLLNSSMQHKPPSERTRAPASRCQSPPSFTAATVSPSTNYFRYYLLINSVNPVIHKTDWICLYAACIILYLRTSSSWWQICENGGTKKNPPLTRELTVNRAYLHLLIQFQQWVQSEAWPLLHISETETSLCQGHQPATCDTHLERTRSTPQSQDRQRTSFSKAKNQHTANFCCFAVSILSQSHHLLFLIGCQSQVGLLNNMSLPEGRGESGGRRGKSGMLLLLKLLWWTMNDNSHPPNIWV